MADRRILRENIGVVYFKFKDGSVVRCICTANSRIAAENGIRSYTDALFDLEAKKVIPIEYLRLESIVKTLDEDTNSDNELYCELDKYLNKYIKNLW